jgi:hypothetical protein
VFIRTRSGKPGRSLRARVLKIDKSDDVIIKRLQSDPEKEETSVFSGNTNVF